MTIVEITIWSIVAAAAIAAMVARWKWRAMLRDFSDMVDSKAAETLRADKMAARIAVSGGILKGAIQIIARLAADLDEAQGRAALHCRMIEDQRRRADAIRERLNTNPPANGRPACGLTPRREVTS